MNTFAVVMQAQELTPLGQWIVIGLSMFSLVCALVLSRAEQIPAWKVRVMAGLAVALILATVAAMPIYAATIIDCKWGTITDWWWLLWGC